MDKEYNRGSKSVKNYLTKFRSFHRDSQGNIVGYTRTGSKQLLQRKGERAGNDSFSKAWYDETRKALKNKPTRKVSRKSGFGGFGYGGVKLPKFRF